MSSEVAEVVDLGTLLVGHLQGKSVLAARRLSPHFVHRLVHALFSRSPARSQLLRCC